MIPVDLTDLLAILWAPVLMCLVLTGIHAYLGVHVLAREVVFVDIAMAQIAALGARCSRSPSAAVTSAARARGTFSSI